MASPSESMDTAPTRPELVADRFGFRARAENGGYFLAPVTRDPFGRKHIGDDAVFVAADGRDIYYTHCAQAALVAKAVRAALAVADGHTSREAAVSNQEES